MMVNSPQTSLSATTPSQAAARAKVQIMRLDARLGTGQGAARERARLANIIASAGGDD